MHTLKPSFLLLLITVTGPLGAASVAAESQNASLDTGAGVPARNEVARTTHPFSTDRVTVKRIYRAKSHRPADGGPAVIIKLLNPDHFYVGGLYWVLWVGVRLSRCLA